ncbi:MAG TPA: sialidase family protein [Frankiaceae bacterium]|nr:sialidase family protein [Frankiaceae bacterium]
MRRTALAFALLAVLGGAPAAPAAPAWAPQCSSVTVSPAYATDGKVACSNRWGVYLSTDRGRTWRAQSPLVTGVPVPNLPIYGVLFSPRYATDRTLYAFSDTLLASVDDGRTFVPAEAGLTSGGLDRMTPFVGAVSPVPGAGERVAFAYTDVVGPAGYQQAVPYVIEADARTRHPVAGSPGTELVRFAVPPRLAPTDPVFALTFRADGRPGVDRCDATFTCATAVATFSGDQVMRTAPRVWVSDDWPARRHVHVVWSTPTGVRAYRSLDGGTTFVPWRSLDRTIRTHRKSLLPPVVTFAHTAGQPNLLYAAVQHDLHSDAKPGTVESELFRSTDAGSTWRLVATSRYHGPRTRAPGRLPGSFGRSLTQEQGLVLAPDGRLFAALSNDPDRDDTAVYCSVDGGRTWAAACAR